MKLGALVNAGAGRVRRHPETLPRLRDAVGSEAVFATGSAEEVPDAIAALAGLGVDTLLVVGGDGTVTGTLTPLLGSWPGEALPAVALCAGGTVNTIARSIGSPGPPEQVARRLREGAPRQVARRALVRARDDRGCAADGMIFANGVGVRWLELYYADSSLGVLGASSVVARITGSALLRGPLARRIFASFRAELSIDGKQFEARDYTVMVAGGIREIGLGFRPFFSAGSDPTRVHMALTGASPVRFLRELPALRLGRTQPGSAIEHHAIREAVVRCESPEPWSMDAEIFAPARELRLGASPPVDFVSVGRRDG